MNKNASVVKQIEPWLLMCFLGHYYFAKPGFGEIIYSSKIIPIPEITRVKTVNETFSTLEKVSLIRSIYLLQLQVHRLF